MVNYSPSSSALAYFAGEIKRLRALAGVTQEQLAEAIKYSASTVAAIETLRLLPSAEVARACDSFFNTDTHLARLQELVEETSVLPWFRDILKIEQDADEVRMYESYQVPALLQTEGYVRAIARAQRPKLADRDMDAAVALRKSRQRNFEIEGLPPVNYMIGHRLWAVMDESALRRTTGGPEVMRDQCEYLLIMSGKPNVTIQVVPEDRGPTCAFGCAFEILRSKSDTLVYVEGVGSARCLRKTDEADRYVMVFDYLRSSALDEEQTIEMVKRYRDERYS